MKTNEFIERVEGLGYRVVDSADYIRVHRGPSLVATVFNGKDKALNTIWNENVSDELFDILVEYARTPIEERKDEKKYYLKLPFEVGNDGFYLNYHNNSGTYSFLSKFESSDWKTQFTQKEIDNLPSQEFIKTLVKEEV